MVSLQSGEPLDLVAVPSPKDIPSELNAPNLRPEPHSHRLPCPALPARFEDALAHLRLAALLFDGHSHPVVVSE